MHHNKVYFISKPKYTYNFKKIKDEQLLTLKKSIKSKSYLIKCLYISKLQSWIENKLQCETVYIQARYQMVALSFIY